MTALAAASVACGDDESTLGVTSSGPGGNGQGGAAQGGSAMGGSGQGAAGPGGAGTGAGSGTYEVCANPSVSYPAGPYGNEPGDVFEPLAMSGWTTENPTQRIDNEPFGAFTMDELRAAHPESFVMLHLAAMF